jgi:hypothetical protein
MDRMNGDNRISGSFNRKRLRFVSLGRHPLLYGEPNPSQTVVQNRRYSSRFRLGEWRITSEAVLILIAVDPKIQMEVVDACPYVTDFIKLDPLLISSWGRILALLE